MKAPQHRGTPRSYLLIDLLDDALLRLFGTVTFSMYLLEELADAGLAGVVDDDDALDHLWMSGGVRHCAFGYGGLCGYGCPGRRCGVVDGFSAAVVVCRASLCCASTAYASARRRLLESYMPLACHRGRTVFRQ